MPRQLICSRCGQTVKISRFNSQAPMANLMRKETLCFDCAFWVNYTQHPMPDTHIIDGALYTFQPVADVLQYMKRRNTDKIAFAYELETDTPVYSFVCKFITNVPNNFKEQYPDQFKFISKRTYVIMTGRVYKECLSKGCWDRYHCLWYNKQKAEPNKPWNDIPTYHQIGGEHCESFIDQETMYNVKFNF